VGEAPQFFDSGLRPPATVGAIPPAISTALMIGDTRVQTGLHADVYTPGFNALTLGVRNWPDQGRDPSTTRIPHISTVFINGPLRRPGPCSPEGGRRHNKHSSSSGRIEANESLRLETRTWARVLVFWTHFYSQKKI
jgi:hypothetical protein